MAKRVEETLPVKKKLWWNKKTKAVLIWTLQIIGVLILAALFSYGFCGTVTMQESSMEPTLQANDKMLISRVSYAIGSPKRGDLIAFRKSSDKDASVHIKRVIATPGETVQIRDGMILINGETYMESGDFPRINNAGLAEEPITLGQNEYFVLGDNRNNSEDSRYADVGMVENGNIVGKIWLRISPFGRIGFL